MFGLHERPYPRIKSQIFLSGVQDKLYYVTMNQQQENRHLRTGSSRGWIRYILLAESSAVDADVIKKCYARMEE